MRYVCLGLAFIVILYILFGCAEHQCTMREWATSYNCK
jgi:hypothetical protein